jgi:fructoselysine 3-epimerase
MKLGTATSLLYLYSIQDAVSLVAEAGFDGIDIWGGRPHIYRKDFSSAELESLRKHIKDCGLIVSSFMPAFYRYPHSLSNPSARVREDSIEYMFQSIDNAAMLGAKIVLVVPDLSLHGQSSLDSRARLIESIDKVSRYASQYDLRLGIEVLHYDETDLVNTSSDALEIIRELGHANLGVVLDTGTLNLSKETPQNALSVLRDLMLQIHINDNHGGHKQENLIPGDGTFDFNNLIQVLSQNNYTGFLSAELSKEYSEDPLPALTTTINRMRNWMQVCHASTQ